MKIDLLLDEVSKKTIFYLGEMLPKIDENWWNNCVLKYLSTMQIDQLKRRNIKDLKGFDLAVLLKVFTSNWRELYKLSSFPYELLNYAKELQTIRNKWAHSSIQVSSGADLYRDFDTIERYLIAVSGNDNDEFIKKIRLEKIKFLKQDNEEDQIKEGKLERSNMQSSEMLKLKRTNAFTLVSRYIKRNSNVLIDKKQFVFSNRVKPYLNWWFEPRNETFKKDLYIALNSHSSKKMYVFMIPSGELFPPENYFRIRKELNDKVTINISGDDIISFTDNLGKDKISLKKYQITTIVYD